MSEKTIPEKMFVKNASALAVVNAGAQHAVLLQQLPQELLRDQGEVDWLLLFASSQAELEQWLAPAIARLGPGGALWVAYPKSTSKLKADLHRDSVREYGQTLGLDSVAIIAIDADWSCLRFKRVTA